MKKLIDWFKGKKSYFIAAGIVIFAVTGAATGQFDWSHATQLIFEGLGLSSLRAGIQKAIEGK